MLSAYDVQAPYKTPHPFYLREFSHNQLKYISLLPFSQLRAEAQNCVITFHQACGLSIAYLGFEHRL